MWLCDSLSGSASCLLLAPQVLLAAGDTFRAAAAEQLEQWAQRSGRASMQPPARSSGRTACCTRQSSEQ